MEVIAVVNHEEPTLYHRHQAKALSSATPDNDFVLLKGGQLSVINGLIGILQVIYL